MHTTPYPPSKHIILDVWGAQHLTDAAHIEHAMREAAAVCGATVLQVMLHQFGEEGGITGVAMLAESHISIHTWPETSYAALDIFMCGTCDAELAIPTFTAAFTPERTSVQIIHRGTPS
jgi:S-adenosylmethionine decarboxylase